MFFYAIAGLINAVTSTFLGFLVYFKNKKVNINRIFTLFCLSIAIWGYAYFAWQISTTKETALFWSRVLMMGAIFMPITYFHFITVFLNIYQKKKNLLVLGYILSFIFLILNLTPLFVKNVEPELFFPYWPKPGIAYHPFLLMFFIYFLYSFHLLYRALPRTTKILQTQIKYLLVGSVFGFFGGATNYFLWYDIPIPPFGSILITLFTILTAFAVIKYHLFEIRVILTESLVGIITLILLVQALTAQTLELKILGFGLLALFGIVGYFLIKSVLKEISLRAKLQKTTKDLKAAYKNIQKLSRMKSEFLKVVNHQLRTPVSIVKGMLSMMEEGSVKGKKLKEFIKKAYISSERLSTILDDILTAQDLMAGERQLEVSPCNIREIVENQVKHFKLIAEQKKLKLILEKSRNIFPLTLANPPMIERIVSRVIDNAILYTDKGQIKVSLDLKKSKDKRFIQISVKDSGLGLTKKDKKKLFKLFHRGEEAISLHPNGSGLGLFIVKNLVELHEGTIKVKSEGRNKGTTFIIRLPISTEI